MTVRAAQAWGDSDFESRVLAQVGVSRSSGDARRPAPRIAPLLRWVGGKQKLLTQLLSFCPEDARERQYYEPFLGAASLFLGLRPRHALLGDANLHLIQTYRAVRDDPISVYRALARYRRKDGEAFYYRARTQYNRSTTSPAQAARFIYLNRTCFNGIFRVNTSGMFNVPYGRKKNPRFPSKEDLITAGAAFRRAALVSGSFERFLPRIRPGGFVYLDPPYPALSDTAFFAHYTMDRFGPDQQKAVAKLAKQIDRRGALFMVSNADTPEIRQLYASFNMRTLPVTRWVTCRTKKHVVNEVVVTNY